MESIINSEDRKKLLEEFLLKANLKQDIYENTVNAFKMLKTSSGTFEKNYKEQLYSSNPRISVEINEKGDFEFTLKFAGDILIFIMHTNIFEFPRAHDVHKLSYLKENENRSYCGIISIYNFLADSFNYNRINDSGYLIGRIFINVDNHYYLEGKREIGLLFNNFADNVFNQQISENILNSAIKYTIEFDLLTPAYDVMKEITVFDIQQLEMQSSTIKTAKRLGFRFQADSGNPKG